MNLLDDYSRFYRLRQCCRDIYVRIGCSAPLVLVVLFAFPVQLAQNVQAAEWTQTPATVSAKAQQSLLLDVVNSGERLVAVGERGHILTSVDNGLGWQQAAVPTIVTLTAVAFPTPLLGWAVGHDGMILHSRDGGQSWQTQLDGFALNQLFIDYYTTQVHDAELRLSQATDDLKLDAETELDEFSYHLEETQDAQAEGPTKPFLDVWFADDKQGIVVGAYGLILRTEDGGQSWQPMMAEMPNPDGFHYNSITRLKDKTLLIVGEAGSLYRSFDQGVSWQALESPYEGSFFGAQPLADPHSVLIYGLRGHAFRSTDQGSSWQPLATPLPATISGSALTAEGQTLLVGSFGVLLFGDSNSGSLTPHRLSSALPNSAVALAGKAETAESAESVAVIVGVGGIRRVEFNSLLKAR